MDERKPNIPGHYLCERCGGTGRQEAGCYNMATKKYDSPAGTCETCYGSGYLGVIMSVNDVDYLVNDPNGFCGMIDDGDVQGAFLTMLDIIKALHSRVKQLECALLQGFDPSKIDPGWVSPMQVVADMIKQEKLRGRPHE